MNAKPITVLRSLCAGFMAMALAACLAAPIAEATELLTNRSFDTPGGAGWAWAPHTDPPPAWVPFAVDGEVDLYRKYQGTEVRMLWQDLDVSNVGGASVTASVLLKMGDVSNFPTPGSISTKVYLEFLDGSSTPQRTLLLSPDNHDVPHGAAGQIFSQTFALPADAQKITGFSVDRTFGGSFYALEFSLDLQQSVGVPLIAVEQPENTPLISGGGSIWCGQSVVGFPPSALVTFTVKNTGTALLSDISVTKTGTNPDDFAVSTLVGSVAPGASTTFTVNFSPSAIDNRTATLSIASNDTTHTPFLVHLTGWGLPLPVVTITTPSEGSTFAGGQPIQLGASVDLLSEAISRLDFYADNVLIGTGQPALFGEWGFPDGSHLSVMPNEASAMVDFSLPNGEGSFWMGGSFVSPLRFEGTFTGWTAAGGDCYGDVAIDFSFATDGTLNATVVGTLPLGEQSLTGGVNGAQFQEFTFSWPDAPLGQHALTARAYFGGGQNVPSLPVNIDVVAVPLIVVEQPAGTALISDTGSVRCGHAVVGSPAPSPMTFTVKNTGTALLSGITLTKAGTNPGDFAVSVLADSVAPGASTTFTVTFTPSDIDNRTATLSIASNDTTHSPFIIHLGGWGFPVPLVTITSPIPGATFASGAAIPLAAMVETFGGSVTGLDFYDGETLIGSAQIGIYGNWYYPDHSMLEVMPGDSGSVIVYYMAPPPDHEYAYIGTFSGNPLVGTISHYNGYITEELPGGADFSFGANNTMDTTIYGMVLMGARTLTGGTSSNPKFTLSWPNASDGTHVLTARAYYGTGKYAVSEPVSITVGAPAPEIVVNGNFETGDTVPWSAGMATPTSAAAQSGGFGLEINGLGPPAFISQEIQTRLIAGKRYHFTAWINLLGVNAEPWLPQTYIPHLSIHFGSSFSPAVIATATNSVGLGWQKLEVSRSFTAAELQAQVVLEVGGFANFQMDDVSGVEVAPVGYDTWAQANFTGEEQTQGLSHPHADPDGRGTSNLLRYGLGLHPRNPERSLLPRLATSTTQPGKLAFEFILPAPPPTDVEYSFGVSSDLQTWTETPLAGLSPEFDQTYIDGPLANRRLIRVVAPATPPGQTGVFMTLLIRQAAGIP